MKTLTLFTTLLLSHAVIAGGFIFPNVAYDHARVYLLNTGESAEKEMPEFSVFRNQVYAESKLGDGWEWTQTMNAQMNAVFKSGVDVMAAGLASCYIPRHGIIYFDKKGTPVASISLCFECMRITFWSSNELPAFADNYSEKQAAKAEKQFADLERVFVKNGIPVYKLAGEYRLFAQSQDSLYSNTGEIIFDYTHISAFGTNLFKTDDVRKWIIKPEFRLKEMPETRFSQREGDTQSWDYITLISDSGTKFTFTSNGPDAFLAEATITDSEIRLPNGISVGMSLEQVQSSFQVWDGIAWPASIIVNYSDATVRYQFSKRTLVKIEMAVI